VVSWAIKALDVERNRAWNQASGRRRIDTAARTQGKALGTHARSSAAATPVEEPEDLTATQHHNSSGSPRLIHACGGAYLLKEGLRYASNSRVTKARRLSIAGSPGHGAVEYRLRRTGTQDRRPPRRHRTMMDSGLSNGLIESTNAKIRLLTRIAFGFHGPKTTHRLNHARARRALPASPRPQRPTDRQEIQIFGRSALPGDASRRRPLCDARISRWRRAELASI